MIKSRAPLRISFGGGGTDVSPYSEQQGGAVLNTTIDKYARVTLTPRHDNQLLITSLDYQLQTKSILHSPAVDPRMKLVYGVINNLKPVFGMELCLSCDTSPGSGLGSSSAMTVALVAAIAKHMGKVVPRGEMAELAYRIERLEVGILGGRQDQYAAAFGGINWMEFAATGTVVQSLALPATTLEELENRLLLCSTGLTRRSDLIIREQLNGYKSGETGVAEAMDEIKAIALRMKETLLSGNLDSFGRMLHLGWETKKQLSSSITNEKIDNLYQSACHAGAIGGKVLGAGGGGYLLFYCSENKEAVAQKLADMGARIVDFRFAFPGVQVWEE